MEVKKISTEQTQDIASFRPLLFDDFIWQEDIKKQLLTASKSARKRKEAVWHTLLSWPSGYWKTTLAQILSKKLSVNIKVITWYAITKPSELISILNSLEINDILFIDEIHRIKPAIEEVLYVAMEDNMMMPEWWNVRISINPFTLIWATTKTESLTQPLKNRFIYKFHLEEYSEKEKRFIIQKYLTHYKINFDYTIINDIADNVINVPREINNFCYKLRDYLISHWSTKTNIILEQNDWENFREWAKLNLWWLTELHNKYLEILTEHKDIPVWLKTISSKLNIWEKAIEDDIEPLLMKLWKIEKTTKWRILSK
jgi:Holliday junction DNA helicase RuvB